MSSVIMNTNSYTTDIPVVFWDNKTGEKVLEVSVPADNLVEFVASNPEIEEVAIFGVKSFNECLKERIQEKVAREYADHKLEIEVM